MKTIFILSFFCLLFVDCSNDRFEQEPAPVGVRPKLIREVESIADVSLQKQAFQNLNPQEKHYIFTKRIRAKATDLTLTNPQKEHLTQLLNNVTPAIYDQTSPDMQQVEYLNKWTKEGKVLFGADRLFDIVATLSPKKYQERAKVSSGCDCSSGSDWCGSGYYCSATGGCTGGSCGTFWLQSCNGGCYRSNQSS